MITHIIYEIVGRKIGCTKNFEARMKMYEQREGVRPWFVCIRERLEDASDQEAGDVEWEWADKFGYPRGVHYTVTMAMIRAATVSPNRFNFATVSPERRVEVAGLAGRKAAEMGVGIHALSSEEKSIAGAEGRAAGRKVLAEMSPTQRTEFYIRMGKVGGRRRMNSMSPEQRSELGHLASQASLAKVSPEQRREWAGKAGRKAYELGVGIHALSSEEKAAAGREGSKTSGFAQRIECPHCGKSSNIANMRRWHFDNCRHKATS